jgi:transposase
VDGYDESIAALAEERYPENALAASGAGNRSDHGTHLCFDAERSSRFAHSREVGPLLGLVPRRRQSGEQDPHLRISKCGDRYLRQLLVQCAHVIMGRFGPDCPLRRWALEHARPSRTAKKRTVVAVARKLAVLLHRLWVRREEVEPFPAIA